LDLRQQSFCTTKDIIIWVNSEMTTWEKSFQLHIWETSYLQQTKHLKINVSKKIIKNFWWDIKLNRVLKWQMTKKCVCSCAWSYCLCVGVCVCVKHL
jgi:aryl-phospho-beta-D-glucosidase BglC (GH1 family)